MYARQRQIILHGDVRRQIQPPPDTLKHKVVHIDDFGETLSTACSRSSNRAHAQQAIAGFDGRWLALDVRQDL